MDQGEVLRALVEIVREIQTSSGREPAAVGGHTVPDEQLSGFDSLNWLEAGAMLNRQLGRDVGDIPWVDPKDGHHRTLTDIAHVLHAGMTSSNKGVQGR